MSIDSKKGIHGLIPRNFKYLAVEWGEKRSNINSEGEDEDSLPVYDGLLHPIESSDEVSHNFCSEVMAGVLDVEPIKMRVRMSQSEKQQKSRYQLEDFKKDWKNYDWTEYMEYL